MKEYIPIPPSFDQYKKTGANGRRHQLLTKKKIGTHCVSVVVQ